ncbi:hypothetical protein [Microvirga sesbaniae]|uniref:hypothetical protein n=1 Tax=Microvirga sesbaniae TaxID=681392 RepID=UPI0021C5D14C|nr:hypothetical protein [Microvirga sp. HBU67692]
MDSREAKTGQQDLRLEAPAGAPFPFQAHRSVGEPALCPSAGCLSRRNSTPIIRQSAVAALLTPTTPT